ncbi:hypothetical protein ES707_12986 [subsurface metagenome]
MGAAVNQVIVSVDKTLTIEFDKNVPYRLGETLIHGKSFSCPV